MWLFTRYGFYSVACVNHCLGADIIDTSRVMVRARKRSHLEALQVRFPALSSLEIERTDHTDYRYRLLMLKTLWTQLVAELAGEQTWNNFKGEAERFQGPSGRDYIHLLHKVWSAAASFQASESKPLDEPGADAQGECIGSSPQWDGITKREMGENPSARQVLADFAKEGDWPGTVSVLRNHPDLINSSRPGGQSDMRRCIKLHIGEPRLES
jgi:hypothetical protein